jgi:drug/metabolite transporter (DMT)-like permease
LSFAGGFFLGWTRKPTGDKIAGVTGLGRIEHMNKLTALGILLFAAVLEAGGDALVRTGLHRDAGATRWIFFAAGALILFGYGVVVNTPDWDFGKLLGLYVVFFFVVAQAISWIVFHQKPATWTVIGGLLIVAGGVVMTLAEG